MIWGFTTPIDQNQRSHIVESQNTNEIEAWTSSVVVCILRSSSQLPTCILGLPSLYFYFYVQLHPSILLCTERVLAFFLSSSNRNRGKAFAVLSKKTITSTLSRSNNCSLKRIGANQPACTQDMIWFCLTHEILRSEILVDMFQSEFSNRCILLHANSNSHRNALHALLYILWACAAAGSSTQGWGGRQACPLDRQLASTYTAGKGDPKGATPVYASWRERDRLHLIDRLKKRSRYPPFANSYQQIVCFSSDFCSYQI
jgi:hypothetical protein